jgi:hypothetical protein
MKTWDQLTQPQRIALRHPCLLAEETAHPRYSSVGPLGSLVLTVNTGYE